MIAVGPAAGDEACDLSRILLVEDDALLRDVCARVLEYHGFEVQTAGDGDEGWKMLCSASYDLLISDHNMPGMTGVDLVKQLRSVGMAIPVILAAASLPDEAYTNTRLRIAARLLKPFSARELVETVRSVLQSSPLAVPQHSILAAAGGAPGPGRSALSA